MKNIKHIGATIIMGILSGLVGCKSVQGPDMTKTLPKLLHVNDITSLEYEMPTNMSKMFDFDKRYENESLRTINVDLSEKDDYKKNNWQSAIIADSAMWDYKGSFWSGLSGVLGSLHLRVLVSQYDGDLKFYILERYEDYLNGPEGLNTGFKKELEPGWDESDIVSLLVESPNDIRIIAINSVNYYHWVLENELPGKRFYYYVHPLNDKTFLSFQFYRTISAKNDKELVEREQRIKDDIISIINTVKL